MRANSVLVAILPVLAVVSAAPHQIEDRQGTIAAPLVTWLAGLFKSEIFKAPPLCDESSSLSDQDYVTTATVNGQQMQMCFANSTSPNLWAQRDADVANCLTNLHYVQADVCISVAGSSCDNGYIAAGGRIQNSRLALIGSGTQKHAQISADESSAIQQGYNSLVGGAASAGWPVISLCTGYCNGATRVMQINWIGDLSC